MKTITSDFSRALLVVLAVVLPAGASFAQQQFHPRHIYNENADARAEIHEALATAASEHKRVILDFGGNWCGDCQVLDIYFHQQPNARLLDASFILVDIDIGHYDHNVDVADKYQVPLKRGVPALAVLDSDGRLLYSQKTGEFEDMRHMNPDSVTSFLDQWKGK
jgi:thiol:disulfide interchange protein